MDARRGIELLLTPGLAPTDWEALERRFRDGVQDPREHVDIAAALGRLDLAPVSKAEVERQCIAIDRAGARLAFRWEDDYPPPLRTIPMAPPALFIRGRLPEHDVPAVAIVGTRKPSAPGSDNRR